MKDPSDWRQGDRSTAIYSATRSCSLVLASKDIWARQRIT